MIVEAFFSVAIYDITFHMNLLALGSIPVEGSSKNKILGFPIMAIATESFLLLPPDKVPESLCSYFYKFNCLIFYVTNFYLYSSAKDFKS